METVFTSHLLLGFYYYPGQISLPFNRSAVTHTHRKFSGATWWLPAEEGLQFGFLWLFSDGTMHL